MEFKSDKLDRLKNFVSSNCVIDGRVTPIYGVNRRRVGWAVDFRMLLADGAMINIIAETFWDIYGCIEPIQVCGMESASILLVTAIVAKGAALGFSCSGFYVRKERKATGLCKLIEGPVYPNRSIIVVDDILNQGASTEKVLTALQIHGLSAREAFFIMDFENDVGRAILSRSNLKHTFLFNLDEFGLKSDVVRAGARRYPQRYRRRWYYYLLGSSGAIPSPKARPIHFQEDIMIAGESGSISLINLENGSPKWEMMVHPGRGGGHFFTPIHLYGDIIFLIHSTGSLYKVSVSNKSIAMKRNDFDRILFDPVSISGTLLLLVTVQKSHGLVKPKVCAVSVDDGSEVWSVCFNEQIYLQPVVSSKLDVVFFVCGDRKVIMMSLADRRVCWQAILDRETAAQMALNEDEELLAVPCADRSCVILDTRTGILKKSLDHVGVVQSRPSWAGERIVFATLENTILVFNAFTGQCLYAVSIFGKVLAAPTLEHDYIWIATTLGSLYKIQINNGSIVSEIKVLGKVLDEVLVTEGRAVTSLTYDGYLERFELDFRDGIPELLNDRVINGQ